MKAKDTLALNLICSIVGNIVLLPLLRGQDCINPNPADCNNLGKCATITLSQPITTTTCTDKNYSARDIIHLGPGFRGLPQPGQKFHAWVDKNIVLPVDYTSSFTQSTFDSRTINTDANTPVGSLAGQADASLAGSATYSIPIYAPPGTSGVMPTISITYNSMGGDGVLGMGWSLNAFSIITRTARNIYNDGKSGGINLDMKDRFLLDGNRLILVPGSVGYYRTEFDFFSKVTPFAGTNGPEKFEVITRDGKTLQYGYTSDSKLLAADNSTVILWAINKLSDQYGNSINYKYSNVGNELRIEEISYSENINAGMQPYNKIRFFYQERQDQNTAYFNGSALKRNLLLRKIEIICEDKKIKDYEFNYSYDIHSFLKEVIEYGDDDKAFNSTVFNYGDATKVPAAPDLETKTSNGDPDDYYWIGAEHWMFDFNGDGKEDILQLIADIIPSYDLPPGSISWINWNLLRNDGNNVFTRVMSDEAFPSGFQSFDRFYPVNRNFIGNMMFTSNDFNGDGLEDLIFTIVNGNDIILNPYFSNGTTLQVQAPCTIAGANTLRFGDFNGDQRMDIFASTFENNKYYVKIYFNGIFNAPNSWEIPENYNYSESFPVDLDGDGRVELANIILNGTKYSAKFNNENIILEFNFSPFNHSFLSANYKITGDFNGDGKTDFLYAYPSNPNPTFNWYLNYSKGDNSFEPKTFTNKFRPPFSDSPWFGVPHYAIDVNGDGKSDVVEIGGNIVKVFISNGIDFEECAPYTLPWSITFPSDINSTGDEVDFGDFDGDGSMEILVNKNQTIVKTIDLDFKPTRRFLHDVANGFNHKTKFQYSPLSAGDNFYTKGNSLSYPLSDFQGPFYAVSSIVTPDGVGGQTTISYTYEGAIIHRQGKGFLGFSKVKSINNTLGFATETEFAQVPNISPVVHFALSKKKHYSIGNSTPVTESTYTNAAKIYGFKRFFPYIEKIETVNNLKSQTVTTNFTFDYDGNLTEQLVDYGVESEKTENIPPFSQDGSWIPYLIKDQTITKTRDEDGTPFVLKFHYSYNSRGKVENIVNVNDLDPVKKLETDNSYDPLTGNLTATTISTDQPGIDPRTTMFYYDMQGRYIEKIRDPLNQERELKYDPRWAKVVYAKDIAGLTTTYEYDPFGRMKKMTPADGIATDYSISWAVGTTVNGIGGTSLSGLIYSTTVQRPGSPSQTTWFDIYNREIKTRTDGYDNPVNTVKLYNSKGLPEIASAPFFDSEIPNIKVFLYENFGFKKGLLKMISNTEGATINYSYSASNGNFLTTIDGPNGSRSQTVDASGKIISSDDEYGVLEFSYFSHGKLRDVKTGSQTLSAMEYDEYARQKKLIEPNAGDIVYRYNAYGEIEYQKDANGEYEMLYDKLGRIYSKKNLPTNTVETTWQYWNTGKGTGQLKFIASSNGSKSFSYDVFGRTSLITENINGSAYNTSYEYDNFSRPFKVTYPSGFFIDYEYNTKGYLDKLKNPSLTYPILDVVSTNALNQYTEYKQNNIITEKTYNALGMLEHTYGGTFFHLENEWNSTKGNLIQRIDHINSLTEDFSYDNFSRQLSSAQVTSNSIPQEIIDVFYYTNGNIANKKRIGNYYYNAGKLDAVEKVGNTDGDVSVLTQDITYTDFNKIQTVSEDNKLLTLTYGPDNQRSKSVLTDENNNELKKIIYSGNYEEITDASGDIYKVHYINSGGTLICIAVIKNNGSPQMFNVYTDHLGSILKVRKIDGTEEFDQSFDAWGRERNPVDWSYTDNPSQKPTWLIRGFTGHEHLDEFALINMNGRVYDPLLGRMLSPDNFVQDATSTQGYNRYSYALNNPLVYTDPDGNSVWLGIAIFAAFIYLQGVEANDWTWAPWKWGATNKAGDPITYQVGVGGNSQGVNSVSAGISAGGPQMVTANFNNQQSAAGPAGSINWSEVDAERGNTPAYYQFGRGTPVTEGSPLVATNDPFYQADTRVDLTTSKSPIQDILRSVKYGSSSNNLSNLYDIIVPNRYGSDIYNLYSKKQTINGYSYLLTVSGYSTSLDKSYYDIYQVGFGYLDRFSTYTPDSRYNKGYSNGFYMVGWDKQYFITIGANSPEGYKYLKSLYHSY